MGRRSKLPWLKEQMKIATDNCIVWPWSRRNGTYGTIFFQGKARLVHRVAFHITTGFDLDSELKVLHKCDNEPCFNPKHLFSGTQQDNVLDAIKKGKREKTHCPSGHLLEGSNLYISPKGHRYCNKCRYYHRATNWERNKLIEAPKR